MSDNTEKTTDAQEQVQAEAQAENTQAPVDETANETTEPTDTQEEQAETTTEPEVEAEAKPEAEPEVRVVEQNLDYKDKYIRLSAEFDNYRKRTLKERMDTIKNAASDILGKLLPIVDNLERALRSTNDATDVAAVREGIELIHKSFLETLRQNGLKEIEALHQPFDVDLHEALTKIPAPSEELKGKIVDVIEKGYTLNDKVIRYAKVVLGE